MSGVGQVLVGLAMAAGLVGAAIPGLPGLLLIWAAGLWWTIADGGGPTRWAVFAALTLLALIGKVTKYALLPVGIGLLAEPAAAVLMLSGWLVGLRLT